MHALHCQHVLKKSVEYAYTRNKIQSPTLPCAGEALPCPLAAIIEHSVYVLWLVFLPTESAHGAAVVYRACCFWPTLAGRSLSTRRTRTCFLTWFPSARTFSPRESCLFSCCRVAIFPGFRREKRLVERSAGWCWLRVRYERFDSKRNRHAMGNKQKPSWNSPVATCACTLGTAGSCTGRFSKFGFPRV